MLAMTETPIEQFLPLFAQAGVGVAFLVPTPTGYHKSIMDATAPVRDLLLKSNVHNYQVQHQGPDSKVMIPAHFVNNDSLTNTLASLYRPVTKQGDPRIWFQNLKRYCTPRNLLALIVIRGEIYVFNLSNVRIANSLFRGGLAYNILQEAARHENAIADELLAKIQEIHNCGFLRSITPGDPGVGDTLEHALGIARNNNRAPDYRGIELKSARLTRNGARRATTRQTLFTKVPDFGKTYREIVEAFGKWQTPRGATVERLQLYETFKASRPNAYGLLLDVDENNDQLKILSQGTVARSFVSGWNLQTLRDALLEKHHETFWVKAISETRNGVEYFRYDKVLHTKGPNATLLAPLFAADKITVDLAAHFKPDGAWRDHGILFKMFPQDLSMLVGNPIEYDL
ncbi:MvaI/BcnI family restriction endonuclease [Oscillibacter sp.]|uniref:MvaI/BcnI family restriction endonuclease n=1 Tax=Oscillibacter sp. TaxID=1945593 RepID=UPI00289F8849|nr:MvaI/BcnI family restriction endonuclease [Oscillibacter sp.]